MRRGLVAAAALALAAAGCGGGDDSDEPEQASTNEALACVQDAGLKAIAIEGDEPVGITGALKISLAPDNTIIVEFFSDAQQAADYSESQAAFLEKTGGGSEVVGDTAVVGVARAGAEGELAQVESCIG